MCHCHGLATANTNCKYIYRDIYIYRPCVACIRVHVDVAWKLLRKQCTFGNHGVSSHSEEKKKDKVFGILN